jgi:hypothetical protein
MTQIKKGGHTGGHVHSDVVQQHIFIFNDLHQYNNNMELSRQQTTQPNRNQRRHFITTDLFIFIFIFAPGRGPWTFHRNEQTQ